MRPGLGNGLGAGGGVPGYANVTMPQPANIIRAWSLRRIVPAIKEGAACKIDRIDPLTSGSETLYFNRKGLITTPAGLSAYAFELYEQTGTATSKLEQATFAACPKIYDATGGQYLGMYFDGGDKLSMGAADSAIEAAAASNEISYNIWLKSSSNGSNQGIMSRSSNTSGSMTLVMNAGKLRSYMRSNLSLETSLTYNDDKWHMATVTRKGNTQEVNGHKLYVDGVKVAEEDVRAIVALSLLFTIGDRAIGGFPFTGSSNDLCIWNKELTSAQISAMYTALSPYYGAGTSR